MSKTLKISNGDFDVDERTGVVNTVSGINKGAQDTARHLLSEFSSFFQEGNEVINFTLKSPSITFSDSLAAQFISESMSRMITKQRNSLLDERVIRVNQLRTQLVGLTTLAFLVEVLFSDGQTAAIAEAVQLDHIVEPDALVRI